MIGALTNLRVLNLTDLTNLTDHAVLGLSTLTRLTQILSIGAHKLQHPLESSGLLAMKSLHSINLFRIPHIDSLTAPEFQPLFKSLPNLRGVYSGPVDPVGMLCTDEPVAEDIYYWDSQLDID